MPPTPIYDLSPKDARRLIDDATAIIRDEWHEAADLARLTRPERDQMWGFYDYAPEGDCDAAIDR